MAEKFSFFKSFHKTFKKLSAEDVGQIVIAMGDYVFEDKDIELDGIVGAILESFKPILDKSISISEARSEASKGHGAPTGNQNAKQNQSNDKQKQTNSNKNNQNQSNDKQKQTDKEKEYGEGIGNMESGVGNKELDSPEEKESATHSPKRTRFVPPTLDEVKAYCFDRKSPVNPETFYEYFNKGNWIDSKGNRVRNWKQKLITWENMGHGDNRASRQQFNPTDYLLQQIYEEEEALKHESNSS